MKSKLLITLVGLAMCMLNCSKKESLDSESAETKVSSFSSLEERSVGAQTATIPTNNDQNKVLALLGKLTLTTRTNQINLDKIGVTDSLGYFAYDSQSGVQCYYKTFAKYDYHCVDTDGSYIFNLGADSVVKDGLKCKKSLEIGCAFESQFTIKTEGRLNKTTKPQAQLASGDYDFAKDQVHLNGLKAYGKYYEIFMGPKNPKDGTYPVTTVLDTVVQPSSVFSSEYIDPPGQLNIKGLLAGDQRYDVILMRVSSPTGIHLEIKDITPSPSK